MLAVLPARADAFTRLFVSSRIFVADLVSIAQTPIALFRPVCVFDAIFARMLLLAELF